MKKELHGGRLGITMPFYGCRNYDDQDKTVSRSSYLYNGNPIFVRTVFILTRILISMQGDDYQQTFVENCFRNDTYLEVLNAIDSHMICIYKRY